MHFSERGRFSTKRQRDPTLMLPDGLSEHMAMFGVADEFTYAAAWEETWSLQSTAAP